MSDPRLQSVSVVTTQKFNFDFLETNVLYYMAIENSCKIIFGAQHRQNINVELCVSYKVDNIYIVVKSYERQGWIDTLVTSFICLRKDEDIDSIYVSKPLYVYFYHAETFRKVPAIFVGEVVMRF